MKLILVSVFSDLQVSNVNLLRNNLHWLVKNVCIFRALLLSGRCLNPWAITVLECLGKIYVYDF